MSDFATLPFDAQAAQIAKLVSSGADPRALLREASTLPDAEPLGRLLDALTAHGRVDAALELELRVTLEALSDAALQHLLTRDSADKGAALLERLAEDALRRWPLARISALAFAIRWLRRRAPAAYARVLAEADGRLSDEPVDGRWLLYADGSRLAKLAADARTTAMVRETVRVAIDALARAPKSISQANAERLLAARVYANPVHFFFELLQNADDAGATRWTASIEADGVTVRHDGAPFSLLDLVGLLSIGQTTKSVAQIGFFGVGFKSVYEICERPRVHSGALDFEIAHVSIPRALAERPALAESDTLLLLPYTGPAQIDVLHARALAIPPETLLTLRHVREVEVRGARGGATRWRLEREGPCEVLRGAGQMRRYRTAARELRFAGVREDGRAQESVVRVAVAVDEDGRPAPLAGATVYAFLPTSERSGLRVLVHAGFDVTLDRERLELGSAWNDALLGAAGDALAEVVAALGAEGHEVLSVLSSEAELAPSMAPLAAALIAGLRTAPCLPGAAGERLAPAHARILDEALGRALAGVDLGGGDRALAALPPRERDVARSLGARPFDAEALAHFLAARLETGAAPPPWLGPAVLEGVARAPITDDALCALPLLVEARGGLVSASAVSVAPARWAELCATLRPMIAADVAERLPAALRARLALRTYDVAQLIRDLRDDTRRALLLTRLDLFYEVLSELSDAHRAQLADVPLLPTLGGTLRAASDVVRLDAVLEPLAELLASRLPVLDPTFVARHTILATRWVAVCDLGELATRITHGLALEVPTLDGLRTVLDAQAATLARDLARRIAALPIFPDLHSTPRSLVGPARALRGTEELAAALPDWPWLAEPGRAFIEAAEAPRIDARALAAALSGSASGLPVVEVRDLARVEAWIAQRADELPGALVDALASEPIWLDIDGVARSLDALRRGTTSSALDALYGALGGRWVGSAGALRFAQALRLDRRLPASDHDALIADLLRADGLPDVPRELLAGALAEACSKLPPTSIAPLARVALFRDERGTARPLASLRAPDPRACHRPGPFRVLLRAGPWPLLCAEDEALFAPVLAIAAPEEAGPADIVRQAHALVAEPELLLRVLDAHADTLDEPARTAIAALPIYASGTGVRMPARALCLRAPFAQSLGEDALRALAIDDALLAPEDEPRAARLGVALCPARTLVEARLLSTLVADARLEAQRPPWDDALALASLATLASQAGVDLTLAPLALDASGHVVRGPLLVAGAVERRLIAALPLAARLADASWATAHVASVPDSPLLGALTPRAIAQALAAACREEAPRQDHLVVRDIEALYAWLRACGSAIATDETARNALAVAAMLPSQGGTLRAPRSLVLDPALPDLGLGWGLAPDVPADVARWLRATFELDRHARRTLVSHLLDGLDVAASADDRARAADLTSFLARTLGAGEVSAAELEERARRLEVRARLRVPFVGGGWDKPRFAWSPGDEVAAQAETFALDLPPRLALGVLDGPSQLLLGACGAKDDVDAATVDACLDGRGLCEGPAARRALARYVALRAIAAPERVERWRLSKRAWVPSGADTLRRPGELLWPDSLTRALFGDEAERFPDPSVIADLEVLDAARLGFARADALTLEDIAPLVDGREARPALLSWLEEALVSRRFTRAAVREALRPRVLLLDDEGVPRPVQALARRGARLLFGTRRGDFSACAALPRLTSALGIPARPDVAMIVSFLAEIGDAADGLDTREQDVLLAHLPDCLTRFGEEAKTERLPKGAAIAVLRAGSLAIARIGDPDVRMLEPVALADELDDDASTALADPMPTARDAALHRRLLASGIPDLWPLFDVHEVLPGPRRTELDEDAEALRVALAAVLGDVVGRRAQVHDTVALRGVLASPHATDATFAVDAWVRDGTLRLTPAALRDPALLAPALARDAEPRAALAEWLEEGRRERRWERLPRAARSSSEATASQETLGIFSRVRRWLGGSAADRATAPDIAARPSKARASQTPKRAPERDGERDARFFKPTAELSEQLEGGDGWLDARRKTPEFGFAFAPPRLEAPWLYAPNFVAARFDRRGQRWEPATLRRPEPRGDAGRLSMRGRLPAGELVLPVPLYARVAELRTGRGEVEVRTTPRGATVVRLDESTEVRMRVSLGHVPDLDGARAMRGADEALGSFVPDDELPEETRAAVLGLDPDDAPIVRALALRDFVRERYRYDPSYLEDPSVGRWLARITQGRAHVHVAALHAAGDATHLGAGVCYELNVLACELLRRAGIPAVIATGWVLDGGALSEPDHLWTIALLEDDAGAPVWVPIDASTTRDGRPLRVSRRPPGRFRAPTDPRAKAPAAPRWDLAAGRDGHGAGGGRAAAGDRATRKRKRLPPRLELIKVLHHLGVLAGRPLDPEERDAVERALTDPAAAAALLDRLRENHDR